MGVKKGEGWTDLWIIGQFDMYSHKIGNILSKHWNTKMLDETLSDQLSNRSMITFRKGQSIKDRLVKSHCVPGGEKTHGWIGNRGFFQCGSCKFWKYAVKFKMAEWIFRLDSLYPNGLNESITYVSFENGLWEVYLNVPYIWICLIFMQSEVGVNRTAIFFHLILI